MNSVAIVGRITREVEIRYGQNQTAVCGFNVAVNRHYKNAQGQYDADFIPCVAIGTSAEFMGKYVRKGDLLSITGRIQTRTYQDQNGQNRAVTEVVVDKVNHLSPKPVDNPNAIPNQQTKPKPQPNPQPNPQQNSFGLDNEEEDTLPWL